MSVTKQILYTVNQAAILLGFGRSTLYNDMKSGRLRYVLRDRSRRIFHDDALDYALRLRESTNPPPTLQPPLRPKIERHVAAGRKGGCRARTKK